MVMTSMLNLVVVDVTVLNICWFWDLLILVLIKICWWSSIMLINCLVGKLFMHFWVYCLIEMIFMCIMLKQKYCHDHAMSILLMMSFIYVKSNSFLFLVPLQFWFLILYSSASTKLLYTPIAGLKGNPVNKSWLQTHTLLQLHQELDSPKYYLYLLKVEGTPGLE